MATFGLGTSRRSSPGQGASTPPLKKYVTWAYFSVSATWNCRQPASLNASASERVVSGGNATATGRPASYSVIVTTEVGRGGPAGRRGPVEARRSPGRRPARGSAAAPGRRGSSRGRSDRPARTRPVDPVDDRRRDELVGLTARVGGLGGGHGGRRLPSAPRRARSRRSRPRSAPSGGRGPSRSSARRPWRSPRPDGRGARRASRSARNAARRRRRRVAPVEQGVDADGRHPAPSRQLGRAPRGAGRWRGRRPAR